MIGVLAVTLFAFLPSLSNGFTNWDDDVYVANNALVRSPSLWGILTTPVYGSYSPVTIWSLALNHAISGDAPWSYHLLNLILHLINTFLVFTFVRELSRGRLWTSAVSALLFGIHPMHVESVAWVAARKDVLYGLFYLIGLLAYLRYVDTTRPRWIAITYLAFVLSIFSKPAAAVLPLTLIVIDLYRGRAMSRGVILEKLPFVATSVVISLLTIREQATIGALERMTHYGLFTRFEFASYALTMYVFKFFIPIGLSAVYPTPQAPDGSFGWQLPASLAVVAVALPLMLVMGRRYRPFLFGVAFFLINALMMLQIVSVGAAIVAERFTYISYIGLAIATSWWIDRTRASSAPPRWIVPALAGAAIVVVGLFVIQTWTRCRVWKNSESLWDDQIRKHPHRVAVAYNNRAQVYRSQGRLRAAIADYDEALALGEGHTAFWVNKADVLFDLNRLPLAIRCYSQALTLSPNVPYLLNRRAAAQLRLGAFSDAASDFTRSLELSPDDWDVLSERGVAYLELNEYKLAMADWQRAIAIAPRHPQNHSLHNLLGLALQKLGRHREAVSEFSSAIDLASANAVPPAGYFANRSSSWLALGELQRAASDNASGIRAKEAAGTQGVRRPDSFQRPQRPQTHS